MSARPNAPHPRPRSDAGGWREFRRRHPRSVYFLFALIVILVAGDVLLLVRRARYAAEIERLRAGMSDVERKRADVLVASEENRLRVTMELIRRQATGDRALHLAISVDSGVMKLERDGAVLREMPVRIGPLRVTAGAAGAPRAVATLGSRTVERLLGAKETWEVPAEVYADRGLPVPEDRRVAGALGAGAMILSGGTVIYGTPTAGPLADSAYVMPGAVRVGTADLRAIVPNITPGITVYFY